MATRKKAKRKTKVKRKKAHATKAATRKKSRPVRKSKAGKEKPVKKVPVRRTSSRKVASTVKPQAKPKRTAQSVKTVAARPTPTPPQPTLPGERIGVVTHYYGHVSVATMRLDSGTLRVGDIIHIRGHTTDFSQKVESLEVNHTQIMEVGPNDDFGLKVAEHVREHDVVYKVQP